jgi:23S rRNA (cytidine1920-2'-O)/16S rRNA (cytidine1409-2'-O)-methyltransferase
MKTRLDQKLVQLGLVLTRSQGESYTKLAQVRVNGKIITKPGFLVDNSDIIQLLAKEQYVSRAGLKLASVAKALKLEFKYKTVLDVGSSTGGFTDYALKHGAQKVIAVDVGTDQLHSLLQNHPQIELHEKTDIRDFKTNQNIDIVVADVSFISLREILPTVSKLANSQTQIVVMVKPQFEAGQSAVKHKGVIKNDKMRREILKDFEIWARQYFIIKDKADSEVSGSKGNQERFYLLQPTNIANK